MGSKNIAVGVIYRPPGQDVNESNTFTDVLLSQITKNDKLVYLMGDFNIILLNEDVHAQTQNFMNILSSYCLYPSITKPTRITANSATPVIIFLQIQSHIKHQVLL